MNRLPKIRWTPEQDAQLRSAYAMSTFTGRRMAIRTLAEQMGITINLCHYRARKIGCILLTNNCRTWTKAELEILEAYAGRVPASRIAKMVHRSEYAINVRLSRMKISGRVKDRGYTFGDLADLTGMDERTLRAFLRSHPMKKNALHNYSEGAVQLWMWDNLEAFELRKFDQEWLKTMLRRAA